jgi:hypothetical protein
MEIVSKVINVLEFIADCTIANFKLYESVGQTYFS